MSEPETPTGEDFGAEVDGAARPDPPARRELQFDGYDVVADEKVTLSPVVIDERAPGTKG